MRIYVKIAVKRKANTSQIYVNSVTQKYYYDADQSEWRQREDGVKSV